VERDGLQGTLPAHHGRKQHDLADGTAVLDPRFRVFLRTRRGFGSRDVFGGLERTFGELHVRQKRLQTNFPAEGLRDGDNLGDARLHPHRRSTGNNHGFNNSFHLWFMVHSPTPPPFAD
jgi:hypothetical protein